MDKLKLNIDGFKCFKEEASIEFNAITLLTGANSAGKSSVVQSLLLLKTLSQGSLSNSDSLIELDLNNEKYALNLGTFDDIRNKSNDTYEDFMEQDSRDIKFLLDGAEASIRIQDNVETSDKVKVVTDKQSLALIRKHLDFSFVYLDAERQPPAMNTRILTIMIFVIVMVEIQVTLSKNTRKMIVQKTGLSIFLMETSGR